MARNNDFAAIKNRFAASNSNSNTNNYYPFFKMPDDAQARIRFLPDANEDNPLGFLIEKLTHSLKVNGENKTVPCLSQHGDDCPICKVAKDYYDRDDKVNGKLYYKKRTYLAQALVIEDPIVDGKHENCEGKVKLVSIGYSLFKIIKDAFESGELDEAPFEYEGGTDFLIKKTKQGEFASYTLSKFARKSTDLDADQQEHVKANLVDLSTLLPKKPDATFVANLLEAALTGKSLKGEDDDTDDDDMGAFAKMKAKAASKAKATDDEDDDAPTKPEVKATPAPKAVVESDDDDEAEALLAQLKAKREAARRAAAGSDE